MDIDATVKGATVGIEEVENMIASIISVSMRKMKLFVFAIRVCPSKGLVVQCTRVQDWLRRVLSTEHHHQVADHRSLLIII